MIITVGLAGLVTGTCSIWMPQLPGNGKSIILETLTGGDTLGSIAVAMLLKPLLTALFIRAGAWAACSPGTARASQPGRSPRWPSTEFGGHASVPTFALIRERAVLQHHPARTGVRRGVPRQLTRSPPIAVWSICCCWPRAAPTSSTPRPPGAGRTAQIPAEH